MKIDLHYSNNPPFCDADFEQKGLGGTEGFIIQVFRELCGQQHQVALYNRQPQLVPLVDEMPDGRKWSSVERFNPQEDRDILISFRMREVFDLHPKGFKVIILADTESIGLGDQVREGKVDLVMFVSQWQKDKIAAEEGIPDDKCFVTANGIKAAEYRKDFEKVPGMCIHTSTPERGLSELLNIWPKIQVVVPQMSLHLFSSFYGWGMSKEQNYEWSAENYGKALAMANKNVTNHIHTGATELREWQLQSQFFLYPTRFLETCCISALEAAAAGCVLICSDVAALKERVIDGETGFLIPGEAGTFEHDYRFVSAVIQLMHQPEKIAKMSNAAKEYAKKYYYETLVKGWMDEWQKRMI